MMPGAYAVAAYPVAAGIPTNGSMPNHRHITFEVAAREGLSVAEVDRVHEVAARDSKTVASRPNLHIVSARNSFQVDP